MSEETPFTFRVNDDLKSRFKAVCNAKDRSMSQKMRDFMRWYVEENSDELQYDIEDKLES